MKSTSLSLAVSLAFLGVSCASEGRLIADDAPQMEGREQAGGEVYDKAVREALEALLSEQADMQSVSASGKKVVAFVGIANKGAEEMRDFRNSLYETVTTVLVENRLFRQLSQSQVDVALRTTNLVPEQLFLAEPRQKFMSVLGKDGLIADYLLFAKVTTETTKGGKTWTGRQESQVTYRFTLELADANTGEILSHKQGQARKYYAK
jgi:hypothetical protein